jgi:hypothetical protein
VRDRPRSSRCHLVSKDQTKEIKLPLTIQKNTRYHDSAPHNVYLQPNVFVGSGLNVSRTSLPVVALSLLDSPLASPADSYNRALSVVKYLRCASYRWVFVLVAPSVTAGSRKHSLQVGCVRPASSMLKNLVIWSGRQQFGNC